MNLMNEQAFNYLDGIGTFKRKLLKQVKWIYNQTLFNNDALRLNCLINSIQYNLEEKTYLSGHDIITEGEVCN